MKRLLREPLLHFALLGAALFVLNAWRESMRPAGDEASARIEVTSDVIERLRSGYERQFNHTPDEDVLRGLVTAHIREEVLCRAALALGLDRDDTIVRRRLAQKMEFLTEDLAGASEPREGVLETFFAANAARYARPARLSFRHVYFSTERRGPGAEAAAAEALPALMKGADDEALGDPFLHGFDFAGRAPEEIAALFGPEFAAHLARQPAGGWFGPVASSYGIHLVHLEAREEPASVRLDEVRAEVLRDFHDERRRAANREIFEGLRERYDITIDEAALSAAAARAEDTAQR